MNIKRILPFLILLLLLVGCHTSRVVEGTSKGQAKGQIAYMEKVVDNGQRAKAVTAKMDMELKALDKNLSVGGRLRMKRDEVIQLSLTVLGFEVGRMEFTPQHVLLVDRVNKQYVRANYGDIGFLQEAELDFHTLQALFWNELFIPGEQQVKSGLSRFHYDDSGHGVKLTVTDAPKFKYTFLTESVPASIVKNVEVTEKHADTGVRVAWSYDNFSELDHRYFPGLMECQILGLDKEFGFTLSLSRLDNDDRWSSETRLSSRYKERRVEEILRQLVGM